LFVLQIFVYSLGKTVKDAANYHISLENVSNDDGKLPKRPIVQAQNIRHSFCPLFQFWLWCVGRFSAWAILDIAVGRFEHIEYLWAVLVRTVLVHGPFWYNSKITLVLALSQLKVKCLMI